MLEGYKCERCEHTWIPRASTEETPTICPKCKSPYWNKARKVQGQTLGKEIAGEKLSKASLVIKPQTKSLLKNQNGYSHEKKLKV